MYVALKNSPAAAHNIQAVVTISNCESDAGCCAMLASLYDFAPEEYGLPPFEDRICGELVPVEQPWTLKGTVVKGFGRGSKELGIPTANLDSASLQVLTSVPWACCSFCCTLLHHEDCTDDVAWSAGGSSGGCLRRIQWLGKHWLLTRGVHDSNEHRCSTWLTPALTSLLDTPKTYA